ncbi:hypothetical protein G8759_08565 [Spirosoma aureum]|uniref:Transposase n=1 Tax=Spirosoma aureum TaxID=2692134 RepID=A0A6G9AKF1_9BACT|nr:hypothetical protein [Spirosoma aureum]QIP12673.1 hypothetical protein G8759_08565 [Spirosoma aureum]
MKTIYAVASLSRHFARIATHTGQQVRVPAHPIAKANESLLTAKRWVLEPIFALLGKYRRLAKDHGRPPHTSEGFNWVVHSRRTLKWIIH